MEIMLRGDTDDPVFRTLLHSWVRIAPDHPATKELREMMYRKTEPPQGGTEEEE